MTNTREQAFAAGEAQAPKALPPLRVLVADDDRDTVLTLMTLLRDEGHDVQGVHTGRHVVGAILDFDPHVVILDIHMPDLSGWEVARRIRTKPGRQPLLIGISGEYKKGGDKVLAHINGFDHYFFKPCDPQAILRVLGQPQGKQA